MLREHSLWCLGGRSLLTFRGHITNIGCPLKSYQMLSGNRGACGELASVNVIYLIYALSWVLVAGCGTCHLVCPTQLGDQGLPCEVGQLGHAFSLLLLFP